MAELGQTREPGLLIPGDAGAIDDNVVAIRGRGHAMDNAGEGLKGIDGGAWIGAAGDAFREQFSYEPGRWFEAAEAFEATAAALAGYAGTLRWAQAQAAEAIRLWDQGQAATTQARQAHDRAVAEADANRMAGQPTVVPSFPDPGEAVRQAARDTLTGARQQLSQAGNRAATAIRAQGDKAPEQSGWDAFWGGAGDVLGSVGHTALDVIGLVPVVGEAADGINALWYTAEGDYTNAALSAAGMVPFAGWAATSTKLGVKTARKADVPNESLSTSVDDMLSSGARMRPRDLLDDVAQRKWAKDAYEDFLKNDRDIGAIAEHLKDVKRADGSSFSNQEISEIKDHLFRKEHPIQNPETGQVEMRRFDPDEDIADAWIRLRSSNSLPEDRVLLEHELAESRYMRENPGADYREAHQHANQHHNWESQVPLNKRQDIDGGW